MNGLECLRIDEFKERPGLQSKCKNLGVYIVGSCIVSLT